LVACILPDSNCKNETEDSDRLKLSEKLMLVKINLKVVHTKIRAGTFDEKYFVS